MMNRGCREPKSKLIQNSAVDYNRAGLLDGTCYRTGFKDGPSARVFMEELQRILRYLDFQCRYGKGQMRVEANAGRAGGCSVGY